jgi:hypothetical protein
MTNYEVDERAQGDRKLFVTHKIRTTDLLNNSTFSGDILLELIVLEFLLHSLRLPIVELVDVLVRVSRYGL